MTARKERDYSQGLIYKLCCNNLEVKEIYVGSTLSFKHRKAQHKCTCNSEKDKKYIYKVYKYIRDNGGWDNWEMILVEEYNARDVRDLESRERYWIEILKATLNCKIPTQTHKEYDKKYDENNKDKVQVKNKNYRENNKDKLREYGKKYREKIKENNNITEEKCAEEENQIG